MSVSISDASDVLPPNSIGTDDGGGTGAATLGGTGTQGGTEAPGMALPRREDVDSHDVHLSEPEPVAIAVRATPSRPQLSAEEKAAVDFLSSGLSTRDGNEEKGDETPKNPPGVDVDAPKAPPGIEEAPWPITFADGSQISLSVRDPGSTTPKPARWQILGNARDGRWTLCDIKEETGGVQYTRAGYTSGTVVALDAPYMLSGYDFHLCAFLFPGFVPVGGGSTPSGHPVPAFGRIVSEHLSLQILPKDAVVFDFAGSPSRFGRKVLASGRKYHAWMPFNWPSDEFRATRGRDGDISMCGDLTDNNGCTSFPCQHANPECFGFFEHCTYYLGEQELINALGHFRNSIVLWHPDTGRDQRRYFGCGRISVSDGEVSSVFPGLDATYVHRLGANRILYNDGFTNGTVTLIFRHTIVDPWTILTQVERVDCRPREPFRRIIFDDLADVVIGILMSSSMTKLTIEIPSYLLQFDFMVGDPFTTTYEDVKRTLGQSVAHFWDQVSAYTHKQPIHWNAVRVSFYVPTLLVSDLRSRLSATSLSAGTSSVAISQAIKHVVRTDSPLERSITCANSGLLHYWVQLEQRGPTIARQFLNMQLGVGLNFCNTPLTRAEISMTRLASIAVAAGATLLLCKGGFITGSLLACANGVLTYRGMSTGERAAVVALLKDYRADDRINKSLLDHFGWLADAVAALGSRVSALVNSIDDKRFAALLSLASTFGGRAASASVSIKKMVVAAGSDCTASMGVMMPKAVKYLRESVSRVVAEKSLISDFWSGLPEYALIMESLIKATASMLSPSIWIRRVRRAVTLTHTFSSYALHFLDLAAKPLAVKRAIGAVFGGGTQMNDVLTHVGAVSGSFEKIRAVSTAIDFLANNCNSVEAASAAAWSLIESVKAQKWHILSAVVEESITMALSKWGISWQLVRALHGLYEGQPASILALGKPGWSSLVKHVAHNAFVPVMNASCQDSTRPVASSKSLVETKEKAKNMWRKMVDMVAGDIIGETRTLIMQTQPALKRAEGSTTKPVGLPVDIIPETKDVLNVGFVGPIPPCLPHTGKDALGNVNTAASVRARAIKELPQERLSSIKEIPPFVSDFLVPEYLEEGIRDSAGSVSIGELVQSFTGIKRDEYVKAAMEDPQILSALRDVPELKEGQRCELFAKREVLPEVFFTVVDAVARSVFQMKPKDSVNFGRYVKGLESVFSKIHGRADPHFFTAGSDDRDMAAHFHDAFARKGFKPATADSSAHDIHYTKEWFEAVLRIFMAAMPFRDFADMYKQYGKLTIFVAALECALVLLHIMTSGRFDTLLTNSFTGMITWKKAMYEAFKLLNMHDCVASAKSFSQACKEHGGGMHNGDDQCWYASPAVYDKIKEKKLVEGYAFEWTVKWEPSGKINSVRLDHDYLSSFFMPDSTGQLRLIGKPFRFLFKSQVLMVEDVHIGRQLGIDALACSPFLSMGPVAHDVPILRVVAAGVAMYLKKLPPTTQVLEVQTRGTRSNYSAIVSERTQHAKAIDLGFSEDPLTHFCDLYGFNAADVQQVEACLAVAVSAWLRKAANLPLMIQSPLLVRGLSVDADWDDARLTDFQLFRLLPMQFSRYGTTPRSRSPAFVAFLTKGLQLQPSELRPNGSQSLKNTTITAISPRELRKTHLELVTKFITGFLRNMQISGHAKIRDRFPRHQAIAYTSAKYPFALYQPTPVIKNTLRVLLALLQRSSYSRMIYIGSGKVPLPLFLSRILRERCNRTDLFDPLLSSSVCQHNSDSKFKYHSRCFAPSDLPSSEDGPILVVSDAWDESYARGHGPVVELHKHLLQLDPEKFHVHVKTSGQVLGRYMYFLPACRPDSREFVSSNCKPAVLEPIDLVTRATDVSSPWPWPAGSWMDNIVATHHHTRSASIPDLKTFLPASLTCGCFDCSAVCAVGAELKDGLFWDFLADNGWNPKGRRLNIPEERAAQSVLMFKRYEASMLRVQEAAVAVPRVRLLEDSLAKISDAQFRVKFTSPLETALLNFTSEQWNALNAGIAGGTDFPVGDSVFPELSRNWEQAPTRPRTIPKYVPKQNREEKTKLPEDFPPLAKDTPKPNLSRQNKTHSQKKKSKFVPMNKTPKPKTQRFDAEAVLKNLRSRPTDRKSKSLLGSIIEQVMDPPPNPPPRPPTPPPMPGPHWPGTPRPMGPRGGGKHSSPVKLLPSVVVLLCLLAIFIGSHGMPNDKSNKSRQASLAPRARPAETKALRVPQSQNRSQRNPAQAQAKAQVYRSKAAEREDSSNAVSDMLGGSRKRDLERKIQSTEDAVIRDKETVPADVITREEAAQHNAISWGETLMYPNLHPPCRFPDLTPFATTVAQSRWDLPVPYITTADGAFDVWTLRLIPSMAAPLWSASSASGMAGIGSSIPWVQPSGSQYAPANYSAMQANFGWYRCTAACIEIKNIGALIAQAGQAYAGCFPPGATSATIAQLASTTFASSISNTEAEAPYIISWIPVAETSIDTATTGSATMNDVGLTYRPLTNPNVLDTNVIFVLYVPHTSAVPTVSLEATVTMDWELIPLTQTIDMFKPKSVIASQDATSAVLSAVTSDANKPPGTQNQEDSPGFLGALAATAGAAASKLGDTAIDFLKDAISDPGSAIDSISQFVSDGLSSIGSFFSFFDPKDAYNKHLIAVGLNRGHLSPFVYTPAGANGMESKEFKAALSVPIDHFASVIVHFAPFGPATDVCRDRREFINALLDEPHAPPSPPGVSSDLVVIDAPQPARFRSSVARPSA